MEERGYEAGNRLRTVDGPYSGSGRRRKVAECTEEIESAPGQNQTEASLGPAEHQS